VRERASLVPLVDVARTPDPDVIVTLFAPVLVILTAWAAVMLTFPPPVVVKARLLLATLMVELVSPWRLNPPLPASRVRPTPLKDALVVAVSPIEAPEFTVTAPEPRVVTEKL